MDGPAARWPWNDPGPAGSGQATAARLDFDYVFGCAWDVMSSVTKSRLHGFHDVVDSEAMFVWLLRRFRAERIVP